MLTPPLNFDSSLETKAPVTLTDHFHHFFESLAMVDALSMMKTSKIFVDRTSLILIENLGISFFNSKFF